MSEFGDKLLSILCKKIAEHVIWTIFQAWKVMENSQGHGKSWKVVENDDDVLEFFVKMH